MSGQEGRVSELSVTFGTCEGLLRILSIAMLWPKIHLILFKRTDNEFPEENQ